MDNQIMRFGLMRHGVAENGSAGQPDSERKLTPDGLRRLRLQASWLKSNGIMFGEIIASPLVRAHQTATTMAEELSLEVSIDSLLASGTSPQEIVQLLSRFDARHSPLLVGHQPDLSTTVAVLTGRNVSFAQGDIAILEREESGYRLLRHLPAQEQLK